MVKLDEIDLRLIDILKENSKLSTHKISKKTGIPITTVYNRIKKLEKEGVIKKYSIVLDEKKLGKILIAYTLIHYDIGIWGKGTTREELKKQLRSLSGAEEISYITGRFDIFLKVRVKDMEEFNAFALGKLRKIPGIGQTETFFVLEEIK